MHLVRYEDLQADTVGTLRRALDFAAGRRARSKSGAPSHLPISRSCGNKSRSKGFREAPRPHTAGNFFRRGTAGGWRDELTAEQIARIEAEPCGHDAAAGL